MGIINEQAAVEVAGAARAMRGVAHGVVEGQVERTRQRLRSSSKTRKSAATRERIMTAASELMAEHGSTDFQMSEVSDRCRMSKGALYYYFADRDELVHAIFEVASDELVSSIERVVSEAPTARDALSGLCAELAQRLRTGSPLALALTRELTESGEGALPLSNSHFLRTVRILAAQIERAKTEGIVRQDVNSELAATFAAGGFLVTSLVSAGGERFGDKDVLASSLLDLSIEGMGTPGEAAAIAGARLA
ncbi:TetR/AcrR family transcriptional regulator [uncultured Olsenella sp.]|uniref:TetR/AcrR family transcriptional regulator n=1 Tax=uncultured Olsenella sp. TaxID=190764 RepID=UPI0026DB9BFD|nr:TetR/AcrR family transcriptional regulator [uncultured Olsenella sp.]